MRRRTLASPQSINNTSPNEPTKMFSGLENAMSVSVIQRFCGLNKYADQLIEVRQDDVVRAYVSWASRRKH